MVIHNITLPIKFTIPLKLQVNSGDNEDRDERFNLIVLGFNFKYYVNNNQQNLQQLTVNRVNTKQ